MLSASPLESVAQLRKTMHAKVQEYVTRHTLHAGIAANMQVFLMIITVESLFRRKNCTLAPIRYAQIGFE